jgi:uncharacterized protein YbjT (DUF2867 family)/ligand-binding SRPBCC domain-containing protein
MSTHVLLASQTIARPIDEVFRFFSEPRNLARITPASMGFEFRSDDFEMRDGLHIDYRLRPVLGVPVSWRTGITSYDPPHRFTDVQLKGPYRRWEHTHTFEAVEEGTRIRDRIEYALPLGPIGDLAHRLVVRGELERIFRHRAQTIEGVFATPGSTRDPRTVAVAGGTGFVGGAIAAELYRRGHRVVVLSHRGSSARGALPDDVEMRAADVASTGGLAEALRGVDTLVISLAFPNSPIEAPRHGRTFDAVDAQGTERLVTAAQTAGVGRLVYLSGAGAAADAERHWFRAKWRAEEAVRGSGLTWTIIRPTWVYGPRDVSLNRFVGFARRLGMVPMTNRGRQLLAPVFVDDVARLAVDSLGDAAAEGQVFEIGGPETLSMSDIIGRALSVAGLRRPILPGPTSLIKALAVPVGLLPSPPLTADAVDFINQPATVDLRPLMERMPRDLTPLDAGLRSYLAPGATPGRLTFETA